MLIGIAVVVAVIATWWSRPTNVAGNGASERSGDQAFQEPSAVVTTKDNNGKAGAPSLAHAEKDGVLVPPADSKPDDPDPTDQFRNAPASAVETAFEAETQLLGPDSRLVDLNRSSAVLTSTRFERYMDALATQASREPLAADLTELYRGSAVDRAKSVDGVFIRRVVCGLKLCLVLGTAPSDDTLKQWHAKFVGNVSAPTLESSMRNLHQPDGSVEFRIVFTTDPASFGVDPNAAGLGRR